MQQDDAGATPEYRHTRWTTTTKVVIVVILVVVAALALYLFRIVFIPLVIGAIMAYILTPLVRLVSRRLRLPHGLATGIIYLIGLAIVIPLPIPLVPWLVGRVIFLRNELINFVAYLDRISTDTVQIAGFELRVGDITTEITGALRELVTTAARESVRLVFDAAETMLLVIFTFLIGFYITRDAERFGNWIRGLIPPDYREDVSRLGVEIDRIWSAFLRGQVILALVVAGLLTTVSAVLGLPQPILVGVLGGLLEFLPSVGHAIWLVLVSILALVEGSSTLPVSNFVFFLIVVGVHIAYTQFDLNFLIPRIIGQQVHLHPMVVIIGIIIGAQVGGVLGIALAAPTIATLRVFGRYIYARLFDMEPFPMVGPPTAPVPERQQQAEALAAQKPAPLPSPGETVARVRHRAKKVLRRDRADDE